MKPIYKLIFTLLLLLPIFSYAQSNNSAQDLKKLLNNIYSLKGSYSQVITNARGKVMQKSSGAMVMLKPNKFRWDISAPNKILIISDGKKLYVYNKSLKQVSVQPLKNNPAATPALLLNAPLQQLQKYFTVQANNQGWYLLTSTDKNSMFRTVKLQFVNNVLKQMQLTDNLGQSGTLRFSSLQINGAVNANDFKFMMPKGVDVIKS